MRTPSAHDPRRLVLAGAAGIALGLLGPSQATAAPALPGEPPARLSQTGLHVDGVHGPLRPGVVAFAPRHALWSDGADKQRWLRLPAGRAIDARRVDAWDFPRGTLLWKQFAVAGRPVETRTVERLVDGQWRFATYVWRADGSDADLAPPQGATLPLAAAPKGRYAVPSRADCGTCHGSTAVPVLGASALQLAGTAVLRELAAQGRLRGLPAALLHSEPLPLAATALEREALGSLHANCGHCHNRSGRQVPVPLTLAQSAADPLGAREAVLGSLLETPTRYRPGSPAAANAAPAAVVAGDAQASLLVQRMRSRLPASQMPPLGTEVPDTDGLAAISRWIDQHLPTRQESSR